MPTQIQTKVFTFDIRSKDLVFPDLFVLKRSTGRQLQCGISTEHTTTFNMTATISFEHSPSKIASGYERHRAGHEPVRYIMYVFAKIDELS